jgi:CheY-like chemotaxis protein
VPTRPQAEERDAAPETPGRGLRAIPVRSEFAACDVRPEKHVAMNLVQRHASLNSTNPRVTIVEADITLALALSHNLKTEGYVVESVESVDRGDEAVRKLVDAPPDLVILDWMSSGISGPEICTRLRAEDATRMLPIIMLSARGRKSCACVVFRRGG